MFTLVMFSKLCIKEILKRVSQKIVLRYNHKGFFLNNISAEPRRPKPPYWNQIEFRADQVSLASWAPFHFVYELCTKCSSLKNTLGKKIKSLIVFLSLNRVKIPAVELNDVGKTRNLCIQFSLQGCVA